MTSSAPKLLKVATLLLILVLALVFPFVAGNPTYVTVAIFALGFAAAATGWNVFSGYTGYIALGHAAYFGIGGYTLAILCQRWHIAGGWIPFLLVPLAGLVAAISSVPLGAIALRTRRHTFVVVTIATFFILQLMSYNLRGLTNGSTGIDFPLITNWGVSLPGMTFADFYNLPFYYVALVMTLVALAVSWFVRNSKFGLGLLAIRDDEDRALGLGVRTASSKLIAFVISAFFAGMAGALLSYFIGNVQPTFTFDALFDVAIALMVFLGGIGTLAGPILGALVLESVQQYSALAFTQGSGGLYLIVYGALFLAVVLLLPQGVIPSLSILWNKYVLRRVEPTDALETEDTAGAGPVSGGAPRVNEGASA
jgi:branched-chain amino acid transport system permease protein